MRSKIEICFLFWVRFKYSKKKLYPYKWLKNFRTDFVETVEYNALNFANLFTHPSFNRNVQTVLFHYGSGQSISSIPVNDVVTSYIFNRDYNFVVIAYEANSIVDTDVSRVHPQTNNKFIQIS